MSGAGPSLSTWNHSIVAPSGRSRAPAEPCGRSAARRTAALVPRRAARGDGTGPLALRLRAPAARRRRGRGRLHARGALSPVPRQGRPRPGHGRVGQGGVGRGGRAHLRRGPVSGRRARRPRAPPRRLPDRRPSGRSRSSSWAASSHALGDRGRRHHARGQRAGRRGGRGARRARAHRRLVAGVRSRPQRDGCVSTATNRFRGVCVRNQHAIYWGAIDPQGRGTTDP